jgi:hypothetical protein
MGKSAYGHVKAAQIKGALPPAEQEEIEHLESLKDHTAEQEARLEELWTEAFRRHVPPQPDPLFDYARQVKESMESGEYELGQL